MTWLRTINIKDCINNEIPAASVGKTIAARLKCLLADQHIIEYERDDLEHIIDDLEDVASIQQCNNVLEALYDWADYNRIWLGY